VEAPIVREVRLGRPRAAAILALGGVAVVVDNSEPDAYPARDEQAVPGSTGKVLEEVR
jgi:hypothetical protein